MNEKKKERMHVSGRWVNERTGEILDYLTSYTGIFHHGFQMLRADVIAFIFIWIGVMVYAYLGITDAIYLRIQI